MDSEPYVKAKLNKEIYSKWRRRWGDFFPSEQYYFQRGGAVPDVEDLSILDVGCGGGGLGTALLDSVSDRIKYTGIDVDQELINFGRQLDPRLELVGGCFPQDLRTDQKFDMVTMFALFPQMPKWRDMLLSLKRYSRKYINISLAVRLDGPTVVDIDTSYLYYLDSGERVHQVIHNIYELLNFCSITEMEAAKLKFFGYRVKNNQSDSFRPLPENRIIRGNLLVVVEEGRFLRGRLGGCSPIDTVPVRAASVVSQKSSRASVRPEIELIIEGHVYHNYNDVETFAFD